MRRASAIAESGNRSPADRFVKRVCCTIALLILAGTFAIRFNLFQTRWLSSDEFEHLHAAWCQSEGLVPYRDFFEHHTPWFYWLLLPLGGPRRPGYGGSLCAARARIERGAHSRCSRRRGLHRGTMGKAGNFLGAIMYTQKLLFAVPWFVLAVWHGICLEAPRMSGLSCLYHRYTITPLVFF